MKNWLFLFCSLFILSSAFAQQEIVARATDLIVAGNYDAANHYLDSLLKKNKKHVDAMMMKGNVILDQEMRKIPDITLKANNDESPFTQSTGEISQSIKIVSEATVRQVEYWWRKCLRIDNRLDIRKGLCTLYAMALMKKELKQQILALIELEKDSTGEQAYNLAEYARKFKERNRFDDAIEMYEFIAQQFPTLAGIRCDIGSEYFYEGRMKDALRYLDSAMSKKNIDESSYLNAAFIYSELGYFDNAYKCFSGYSNAYNAKMDVFYKGLMLFSDRDENAIDTLQYFVSSVDSNAYYPEYLLANELLAHKASYTLTDYQNLVSDKHPEWYLPLIYQHAMRQFGDTCKPFIDYGVFHNRLKSYCTAIQFLEEGEHCTLTGDAREDWQLNYAFALYQCGVKEKALLNFNQLTFSKNMFRQQAAKYFIAKLMLADNQPEKAKSILKSVVESPEDTKYKSLSQYLLATIKP